MRNFLNKKKIKTDSEKPYTFICNEENHQNDLIFHTFATNTFLKWLYISLNSINLSYGYSTKKIIQTLNASDMQKKYINNFSNNCDLYNLVLSDDYIAEKIDIPISKINNFKSELKHGLTTQENYKYKLFISVQLRYLSLKNTLDTYSNNKNFKYLIHSDIDVNHRSNVLNKIQNKNFDIALFGRGFLSNINPPLGAYIIFKNTKKAKIFLEKWGNCINSIEFKYWKRGYGQTTLKEVLSYAIKENDIDFLDLSNLNEIKFSKLSEKDSDIWLNSNSKHKGSAMKVPFEDSVLDLSKKIDNLSNRLDKL